MKLKLMNYPTETEHEAMGKRQRLSLRVFFFFFFAALHPTFKHAP